MIQQKWPKGFSGVYAPRTDAPFVPRVLCAPAGGWLVNAVYGSGSTGAYATAHLGPPGYAGFKEVVRTGHLLGLDYDADPVHEPYGVPTWYEVRAGRPVMAGRVDPRHPFYAADARDYRAYGDLVVAVPTRTDLVHRLLRAAHGCPDGCALVFVADSVTARSAALSFPTRGRAQSAYHGAGCVSGDGLTVLVYGSEGYVVFDNPLDL